MLINIAIVEDDEQSAERTKSYIDRFQEQSEHSFSVRHFKDGLDFLANYHSGFNIVFMDVEMPFMNGMEVAKRMRKIDSRAVLIFVTNMAQYAIEGYEVDALDYIVKPVEYFNFSVKLKKAIRHLDDRTEENILLARPNGFVRVAIAGIIYIEVNDHKLLFYTDNAIYEIRGTLSAYESRLTPFGFSKCNHCYLVNLKYIKGVDDEYVTLANGEKLQISRPKRKKFVDDLKEFYKDDIVM
jgi:DNA-binding LytR/AlgR family response regulator